MAEMQYCAAVKNEVNEQKAAQKQLNANVKNFFGKIYKFNRAVKKAHKKGVYKIEKVKQALRKEAQEINEQYSKNKTEIEEHAAKPEGRGIFLKGAGIAAIYFLLYSLTAAVSMRWQGAREIAEKVYDAIFKSPLNLDSMGAFIFGIGVPLIAGIVGGIAAGIIRSCRNNALWEALENARELLRD